jgi:hypothetical protein
MKVHTKRRIAEVVVSEDTVLYRRNLVIFLRVIASIMLEITIAKVVRIVNACVFTLSM